MKNVKLVALVVLVVTLAVGGVMVGRPHEKTIDNNDYYYLSYEIKLGDTYWSIAEEYKMPDDDIREWINEVKKVNDVNSDYLRSGCHLIILAKNN